MNVQRALALPLVILALALAGAAAWAALRGPAESADWPAARRLNGP